MNKLRRIFSILLLIGLAFTGTTPAAARTTNNKATAESKKPMASAMNSTAQAVSAGEGHTCLLTAVGGVKCWGNNENGQLGDGTMTNSLTPVDVSGLASGVSAISVGGNHTCALTTGGGMKCWGDNQFGQLGNGTTKGSPTPVDVMGLSSGVNAIDVGYQHTCVLTSFGGVKCWGNNSDGRLGNGTTIDSPIPTDVINLSSGMVAVSSGRFHTCAVTILGGLKCWGSNYAGKLGNGTYNQSSLPVEVSGLSSGVASVSTGWHHTCAVTISGGVKCWGENSIGQLGNESIYNSPFPVDVIGLSNGVITVATGGFHTCALTSTGGTKCWGNNYAGILGNGMTIEAAAFTPVDVNSLSIGVAAIDTGTGHTCALMASGGVKCWGSNFFGQLGNGTSNRITAPEDVSGLVSGVAAVSTGGFHTCALANTGGVKCWGENSDGQLGNGTTHNSTIPLDVSGLLTGVTSISSGGTFTCALMNTGGVKCWGGNYNGQLGNGTPFNSSTPVEVVGLSNDVIAISSGDRHTCALTASGGVKCWGDNLAIPADVSGLSGGITAISAGDNHNCALTTVGGVKCWGGNQFGQLGNETTTDSNTPVDVSGLTSGVIDISSGMNYTCVVTASGGAKCWGANYNGQLGNGTTTGSLTPTVVSGLSSGVVAVSTTSISIIDSHGENRTCALTSSGGVKCWGSNYFGQLGNGTWVDSFTPVDVSGLSNGVVSISVGWATTCALTSVGGVKCWGRNEIGQVGNGIKIGFPVDVIGFESNLISTIYLPIVQQK